jgi:hypothetical protein
MGKFVFVIESTCLKEGGTLGGDKKAGPIMLELFIGGLGQRNDHSVRGTGTTALFDEEAKAAGGIPLGGELDNLMSSPIGQLDHGGKIRIGRIGVKRSPMIEELSSKPAR